MVKLCSFSLYIACIVDSVDRWKFWQFCDHIVVAGISRRTGDTIIIIIIIWKKHMAGCSDHPTISHISYCHPNNHRTIGNKFVFYCNRDVIPFRVKSIFAK
jgi:hypothetical protein